MNAIKNKEIDIVKVFLLIEEKEIDRAVNKVYFIKMPKIKATDKRVVYCEGM
jgi:hypothetical protein